jgi:hypothetical protein
MYRGGTNASRALLVTPSVSANSFFYFPPAIAYSPTKMAFSYAPTAGVNATANGNLTVSATIPILPTGVNQAYIGQRGGVLSMNGYIKKVAYYPTALSNAELQEITS